MANVTLLTIDQLGCYNSDQKLSIFAGVLPYSPVSDFARLTGVSVYPAWGKIKTPYGLIMTSSVKTVQPRKNALFSVYSLFDADINNDNKAMAGILPVIPAEITKSLKPKNERLEKLENGKTIRICEFGSYPQKVIVDPKTIQDFKKLAQKTDKVYTINKGKASFCSDAESSFKEANLPVYTFQDRKFVIYDNKYLVEVLPVEFMMDPSGVWVSKNILIGNIPYWDQTHSGTKFEQTRAAEFLSIFIHQMARDYSKINAPLNKKSQQVVVVHARAVQTKNFEPEHSVVSDQTTKTQRETPQPSAPKRLVSYHRKSFVSFGYSQKGSKTNSNEKQYQ